MVSADLVSFVDLQRMTKLELLSHTFPYLIMCLLMNLIFFMTCDMDECINTNFINVELRFIHCYCIVPLKALLSLCICIETEDWVIACKELNHQEINL